MSAGSPLRFVHASDLHLEQPPYGLAEVPDHLRELLLESPYRAAQRVLDTAIAEEADFLVLAGDVLDAASTGPRGPAFLVRQFERLREHDIRVYWSPGQADPPQRWPEYVELPENVHRFTSDRVEPVIHRRNGVAVARLLATDFRHDDTGLFTLAVVHGEDAASLAGGEIDYWAFGGRHHETTHAADSWSAHFPGSPQGRCPTETGAHGCTVVSVDPDGRIEDRQVPTDVFRWRHETIEFDETTPLEQLQAECRESINNLFQAEPDVTHLIRWTLQGEGPLADDLRRGGLDALLLDELRTEFAGRSPAAWSISIKVETPGILAQAWHQDDSFLSGFLDVLRSHQQQADGELPLEQYAGSSQHLAELTTPQDRKRLLDEVASRGSELLAGRAS